MLFEKYRGIGFNRLWAGGASPMPFPCIGDREAWESLLPESREYWLALAEKQLNYDWPALKMEHYIALKRSGNISAYINPHWERRSILGTLVVAECMEDRGRFLDQILNGIFAICEETSWMQPIANTYLQKINTAECLPDRQDHVVDLNSSETAALLAWTYYLLKDRLDCISQRIRSRMVNEVRERVLLPYMEKDDYWWMGFMPGTRVNNWNPWCNSNVLMSFLLLEEDPQVRDNGIRKLLRSLDVFLATHSPDGCCDEGPMYWSRSGGSLYDCLELLDLAANHAVDTFGEPLVRDIGRYLYRTHISGDYYVDFADGDAKAGTFGDVAFSYGKAIGDLRLMQLGASVPAQTVELVNWFPLYRYVRGLFHEKERRAFGQMAPFVRDSWMENAQVMTAREAEGSNDGLYLAAKGGHNLESHNHNDVGSFIVYADGLPVFIDLGTEEYTAKTFSPQRFELWYLQSAYHNAPTIRGVMQKDGREFRAEAADYQQEEQLAQLELDIAKAYPVEAGIDTWRRTFRLLRGEAAAIEIEDSFTLHNPAEDLYFSLMTVAEPVQAGEGSFTVEYAEGKRVCCSFDAGLLSLQWEKIRLEDRRLRGNWGDSVYRIVLKAKVPVLEGAVKLTVACG